MTERILLVAIVSMFVLWGSNCLAWIDGQIVNRCGLWQQFSGQPMVITLGDVARLPPVVVTKTERTGGYIGCSGNTLRVEGIAIDGLKNPLDFTGLCDSVPRQTLSVAPSPPVVPQGACVSVEDGKIKSAGTSCAPPSICQGSNCVSYFGSVGTSMVIHGYAAGGGGGGNYVPPRYTTTGTMTMWERY